MRKLAPWIHCDDLLELIENTEKEILQHLREGNSITFRDFFTFEPVIEGSFYHEDDVFDSSRHSYSARILPGQKLHRLDREHRIRIRKIKGIRRHLK
jgi:hypothetical protein